MIFVGTLDGVFKVARIREEAQGWKGARLYDFVQRTLKEQFRF
jgi:hypothetical protein